MGVHCTRWEPNEIRRIDRRPWVIERFADGRGDCKCHPGGPVIRDLIIKSADGSLGSDVTAFWEADATNLAFHMPGGKISPLVLEVLQASRRAADGRQRKLNEGVFPFFFNLFFLFLQRICTY